MGTQLEIECNIVTRGAVVSPCKKYRYKLWRLWDLSKPCVLFIMLNPSTADAEDDDSTIRRCINFAKSWGAGGIYVGNLYAYRATKPGDLWHAHKTGYDVSGPLNDQYIQEMARHAEIVVFAWGQNGLKASDRWPKMKHLIGKKMPHCISILPSGMPAHPLYLLSTLTPIPF